MRSKFTGSGKLGLIYCHPAKVSTMQANHYLPEYIWFQNPKSLFRFVWKKVHIPASLSWLNMEKQRLFMLPSHLQFSMSTFLVTIQFLFIFCV